MRAHANWVLTNPDMLHRGILPGHARWASFLRRLRYVVVDECHTYRGVFGSHVAQVLRRLRRVCAPYGADADRSCSRRRRSPDPAASATRLIGVPVAAVTDDASPRGARDLRAVGAAADRAARRARRAGAPRRRRRGRRGCWPTWWSRARARWPSSGRGAAPS